MRTAAPLVRFLVAGVVGAGLAWTWAAYRAPSDAFENTAYVERIASPLQSTPAVRDLSYVRTSAEPDVASASSRVIEPPPLPPDNSPYEQTRAALSRDLQSRGSEVSLQAMSDAHESIVQSGEDPEWTRPIEAQLRNIIFQHPATGAVQVESLICRKAGCEIQVRGMKLQARRTRSDPPVQDWQAIVAAIFASDLRESVSLGHSSVMQVGDFTVYVTTLTRRPTY